jgi:phosphoribosylformylglycinamidine (FGAM) synthase-like enzyme
MCHFDHKKFIGERQACPFEIVAKLTNLKYRQQNVRLCLEQKSELERKILFTKQPKQQQQRQQRQQQHQQQQQQQQQQQHQQQQQQQRQQQQETKNCLYIIFVWGL